MRLDDEILANKNKVDKKKVDKDNVDKNVIGSYIIIGLVILILQFPFYMAYATLNMILVGVCFVL